jgi:Ca2+-binding EF-hand superfamily protein
MKGSNMTGIAVVLGATLMAAAAGAQEATTDWDDPYADDGAGPEEVSVAPHVNRPDVQPNERSVPQAPIQRTWPGEPPSAPGQTPPAQPAQAVAAEQAQPKTVTTPREQSEVVNGQPASLAEPAMSGAMPIIGLMDAAESARMLRTSSEAWLATVDRDGDAMISRQEALVAGQELVGGLFFRVDRNHDGRLAPIELRAARKILFLEHPMIKVLVRSPRSNSFSMRQLLGYLDTRGDRGLDLNEANLAVSSAVDALFALSDTNRDGRIAISELHGTANKLNETSARVALQSADLDKNGMVGSEEFDEAMRRASRRAFRQMDRNGDGMLSAEEAVRSPEPKRPLAINTEPAQDAPPVQDALDLNRAPTGR